MDRRKERERVEGMRKNMKDKRREEIRELEKILLSNHFRSSLIQVQRPQITIIFTIMNLILLQLFNKAPPPPTPPLFFSFLCHSIKDSYH